MTFLLLTRVILKAILACREFFHESFEWCKGKEKLSSFDWSMDSPDPYHECSRLDEFWRYVCAQWSCLLCPSTCLNWWLGPIYFAWESQFSPPPPPRRQVSSHRPSLRFVLQWRKPSDRLSVPIFGEELLRVSNPRRLCEGRRNLLDIVSVHWSIMSRTGLDRLS